MAGLSKKKEKKLSVVNWRKEKWLDQVNNEDCKKKNVRGQELRNVDVKLRKAQIRKLKTGIDWLTEMLRERELRVKMRMSELEVLTIESQYAFIPEASVSRDLH